MFMLLLACSFNGPSTLLEPNSLLDWPNNNYYPKPKVPRHRVLWTLGVRGQEHDLLLSLRGGLGF